MQTLSEFDWEFGTDEQCRAFLAKMRWLNGVRCPRCKASEKVYKLAARPYHWVCKSGKETVDKQTGEVMVCHKRNGYRFSVITGTIFEDTKIALNIWFKVGYLMLTSKKGISALQIHRVIFGEKSTHDYHTSWYMCTRWRAAMAGDMYEPLSGIVEADETYIGGKDRNRHAWQKSARQRERGIGVARVIGSQDAPTLAGFVRNVVSKNVSLVVTDEHKDYNYVDRNLPHQSVRQSAGEYVRREVHTNSIESFWSLLKRGVVGTYHNVSAKYLPFYLNEFSFRFNNRNNEDMFADLITTCSQ